MKSILTLCLMFAASTSYAQDIKLQVGDLISINIGSSINGPYKTTEIESVDENGGFTLKHLNNLGTVKKELHPMLFVTREGLCLDDLCIGKSVKFKILLSRFHDNGRVVGIQLRADKNQERRVLIQREGNEMENVFIDLSVDRVSPVFPLETRE